MDNAIFRVNGDRKSLFAATIKLVFEQHKGFDDAHSKIEGFKFDKNYGLILYWCNKRPEVNSFLMPALPEDIIDMLWNWVHSDQAKEVNPSDGCEDMVDCDISTKVGWEIYREEWGHVAGDCYAMFAIKPAYTWYGK